MLICNACSRPSPSDGKFCRFCGHEFTDEQLEAGRNDTASTLAQARSALELDRLEDALALAESVRASEPANAEALLICAECHETRGDLHEALFCYEEALRLEPNEVLERAKLPRLRKAVVARELEDEWKPKRRTAILAGVCATATVAVLGITLAIALNPSASSGQNENRGLGTNYALNNPSNLSPGSSGPALGQQPQDKSLSIGDEQPLGTDRPAGSTESALGGIKAPAGFSALPRADANGDRNEVSGSSRPLRPPVNGDLNITPTDQPQPKPTLDPDPPVDTKTSDVGSTVTERPGVIEIKPSANNPVKRGGSEVLPDTGDSANEAQALIQVARQHFQLGNYRAAADAYEKALAAGASPGTTNQRLAQSLEKLGRKADAISAYNRAIRAFEAAGPGRSAAALEACKAAIKVLQGG